MGSPIMICVAAQERKHPSCVHHYCSRAQFAHMSGNFVDRDLGPEEIALVGFHRQATTAMLIGALFPGCDEARALFQQFVVLLGVLQNGSDSEFFLLTILISVLQHTALWSLLYLQIRPRCGVW